MDRGIWWAMVHRVTETSEVILACMQANNYAGSDQCSDSWVLRNDPNFNIFKIRKRGSIKFECVYNNK